MGLNGYQMPENVVHYLAGELTDDVRQLESGMNGVAAKSSLLGIPIDLNLAESVVKNIVRQRKRITIDVIKKLVCKYYNISIEDVAFAQTKFCQAKADSHIPVAALYRCTLAEHRKVL